MLTDSNKRLREACVCDEQIGCRKRRGRDEGAVGLVEPSAGSIAGRSHQCRQQEKSDER
jgi:hypothetical protein